MNINTDKVRKKDQSIIVDFYFDSTHFLFYLEKLGSPLLGGIFDMPGILYVL